MLHHEQEPLYCDGEEVLSWLAHTRLDANQPDAAAPFAMDGTPNATDLSTPNDLAPIMIPIPKARVSSPTPTRRLFRFPAPSTHPTPTRQAALRATAKYPVHRRSLDSDTKPALPQPLLDLLQELFDIGSDKRAVIPSQFQGTLPAVWYNDPNQNRNLFLSLDGTTNPADDFALRHRHATLQSIQRHSQLCEARLEHEAGWNELVHSPVPSDALRDHSSVHFRNITTCPVRASYNDPDAAVSATKIDYAMLLDATTVDALRLRPQLGDVPFTHFALSDDAPTPIAISI
ncbi:hypothetical protein B0H67DRAFT_646014 [Lasiosphaeris hirsuta]|uniref:PD-(D/E)XK nuclease-like domain-containing protein n=1 Tax=Lasiosphaeris hirsuta TaxID=260670 RepID=A0AA40AIB9_9PEZI|nr:hypothetical protein B0H67DRAFT_646014 [Lasiosphaeris hirsuta]